MSDIINTATALPQLDKRAEVHTVDISTGSGGSGSATVSWDESFEGGVFAVTSGDADGDFFLSAVGPSQATAEVSGSSVTSGTVTATVLVVGDD